MVELKNERIEEILHKETPKKEEAEAILRTVYTRYMQLYEKYFADPDALNDEDIRGMKEYHEETRSLMKYYYMDIDLDICESLKEFDKNYTDKLLGSEWRKFLDHHYEEFKNEEECDDKSEEALRAEFRDKMLDDFYDVMDYTVRDGFKTGSKTAEEMGSGLAGLLFGGGDK